MALRHRPSFTLAIAAILVACGTGGVVAVSLSAKQDIGRSVTTDSSGISTTAISATPTAEIRVFPVLGEAKTQADTSADSNTEILSGLYAGQSTAAANPSLGRIAFSSPDALLLLVPARGQICLESEGRQIGIVTNCNGLRTVAQDGVFVAGSTGGTGETTTSYFAGVLPGGRASHIELITANGDTVPVIAQASGGFFSFVSSTVTEIKYINRAGTATRVTV